MNESKEWKRSSIDAEGIGEPRIKHRVRLKSTKVLESRPFIRVLDPEEDFISVPSLDEWRRRQMKGRVMRSSSESCLGPIQGPYKIMEEGKRQRVLLPL